MYLNTLVHLLFSKLGLILAFIILDYHQKRYTHQLFSLLDLYPTKEILPISLREVDREFRVGEVLENTLI